MSSESESDEDYVPGEPEQLSEEESADDETEKQYENEVESKTIKRKANQLDKGKKKLKKTRNSDKNIVSETEDDKTDVAEELLNPEEQKKREEDLWAKFLDGTDAKPKSAPKETNNCQAPKPTQNKEKIETNTPQVNNAKEKERRIFEFAGETIVVEDNVIKEKIKTEEGPAAGIKLDGPSTNRSNGKPGAKPGGLMNVLGQLNKKNKLSTLEKSKLDWSTYKKEEGIEEEIQSHNKGKNGYLDRRDFLERADVRQYEIERDLRMTRRSNR